MVGPQMGATQTMPQMPQHGMPNMPQQPNQQSNTEYPPQMYPPMFNFYQGWNNPNQKWNQWF